MEEVNERLRFWVNYHNHGYAISTIPELDAKNIIDNMTPKMFKTFLSLPCLEDLSQPLKKYIGNYVNHLHYTHLKNIKIKSKKSYSQYLHNQIVLIKYFAKGAMRCEN